MTSEQIRIRYEKNFYDEEYMLKKYASCADLTFRELKIYYAEKDFHVDDSSFEANFNLRNKDGDYNLLTELLVFNEFIYSILATEDCISDFLNAHYFIVFVKHMIISSFNIFIDM